MSDTKHALIQVVSEVFEDWMARIQEVVSAAQESGEVRSGLSSEAIARHIVFAIEGGIMLSRLKKEEAPLKDCLETLRELLLVRRETPRRVEREQQFGAGSTDGGERRSP